MKVNFRDTFNSFKGYLSENVPELGRVITHWEDPFTANKNQTVLLPHASSESGGKIFFSIRLCASTAEKNSDAIPQAQTELMNKLFGAVYNSNVPSPILGASIDNAEYYDPVPQSPTVGVIDMTIILTVDYFDDCN